MRLLEVFTSKIVQKGGLIALHDIIMYYLVIILFSVGWELFSVIWNIYSNKSPMITKYFHRLVLANKLSKITNPLKRIWVSTLKVINILNSRNIITGLL